MKSADSDLPPSDLLADVLLLSAGAGILTSSLITVMAASDAFAARLLASVQQTSELSTLQMNSLASSLADLQAARSAGRMIRTEVRAKTSGGLPPGAPVVT